ncbi:MAG: alpha/beta hydrolase, partial [Pseudomonadota bacterium]|nr:alpha/beta hydrolase [Pseudomonadota bacterium]
DPPSAAQVRASPHHADLWVLYDRFRHPTLLLRGPASDVLTAATAAAMAARGPRAEVIEFAGCGHAPALMDANQIAAIHAWMKRFDPDPDAPAADAAP